MDLESLLDIKASTASKFPEKMSAAPGVMSIVTKDELRRFGGLTLGEILDRVAGLTMTTTSFTDRRMVAARGDQTKIDGGHILFLINGRPAREVLEGGIISHLQESFPADNLKMIDFTIRLDINADPGQRAGLRFSYKLLRLVLCPTNRCTIDGVRFMLGHVTKTYRFDFECPAAGAN